MQNPSPNSLTFYPAYCLSISPTYNTWARLTSADVHALRERDGYDGQNIYFHLNHPIKWIRLVGVIVALDCHPNRWSMVLDDSCGTTIEVLCWRPTPSPPLNNTTTGMPEIATFKVKEDGGTAGDPKHVGVTTTGRTVNLTGFDVGAVVKIKGGVGMFRGEKQVMLERIALIHNTNDEIACWREYLAFRREILNSPWTVSDQDLKRASREAAGLESHRKLGEDQRRQKRKKLREHGKDELQRRKKRELQVTEPALKGPEQKNISSNRIRKTEVNIPKGQQDSLNRLECWEICPKKDLL